MSGSNACKLTSLESRKKVVDAYLAAFKKTRLLMLIGGGECLKYAARQGTGWRADCLGGHGRLLEDLVAHAARLSRLVPRGRLAGYLEDRARGLGIVLGHAEVV